MRGRRAGGGVAQPGHVAGHHLGRQVLAGDLLGLVEPPLQTQDQGQVLTHGHGGAGLGGGGAQQGLGLGRIAVGGVVQGQIGQRGRVLRRQSDGLAVGLQRFVRPTGLIIGDGHQSGGPPVGGGLGLGLAGGLDGVEALALADLGARLLEQGLFGVRLGQQHPLGGVQRLVIASHGAQRLGQADPGLGVHGIEIGFTGPEGGAGERVEPLGHGPLLGGGFARGRRLGGGRRRRGLGGRGFRLRRARQGGARQAEDEGGCGEGRHATHERHGLRGRRHPRPGA